MDFKSFGAGLTAMMASIIGLAALAVILSSRANTQGVISSAGSAFAGLIGAAVSPVTGSSMAGFSGSTPSFAQYSNSGGNSSYGGGSLNIAGNGFGVSVPGNLISSSLGDLFGGGGNTASADFGSDFSG